VTGEYFSRLPFINPISSSCMGLPLSDINIVNNQNLVFRPTFGDYYVDSLTGQVKQPSRGIFEVQNSKGSTDNTRYVFTVIFWRFQGSPENDAYD